MPIAVPDVFFSHLIRKLTGDLCSETSFEDVFLFILFFFSFLLFPLWFLLFYVCLLFLNPVWHMDPERERNQSCFWFLLKRYAFSRFGCSWRAESIRIQVIQQFQPHQWHCDGSHGCRDLVIWSQHSFSPLYVKNHYFIFIWTAKGPEPQPCSKVQLAVALAFSTKQIPCAKKVMGMDVVDQWERNENAWEVWCLMICMASTSCTAKYFWLWA